jgi:hypothetical protein
MRIVNERVFYNHADFVAACEQLADELVDFITDSSNLKIRIIFGKASEDTENWLMEISEPVKN